MVRYLAENDVEKLLTMKIALEEVERGLRDRALGRAVDTPRVRTRSERGTLHIMQTAAPELDRIGYKAVCAGAGYAKGNRFFVHLFDIDTGDLDAIVEGRHMGMVRTGAASALATRHLAREDAAVVATIGAGRQAIGQLEGLTHVRRIREVRVSSRTPERAREFCAAMSGPLGISLVPAASAAEAVKGADIVNVITGSADPVLCGDWLEAGQHVNAAGANSLTRRELDVRAVARCDRIVVDSRDTARNECGDLLPLVEQGRLQWNTLPELGELLTGRAPGRESHDEITLFESQGMGIEDIYVATRLVAMARERAVGIDLPIGNRPN